MKNSTPDKDNIFNWIIVGLGNPGQEYDDTRHNIGFEAIKFIAKKWNFISPKEFEDYLSGKKNLEGRNVLLTFDDGFYSNKLIADKILNPLGIKALFFIVGNFAQLKPDQDPKDFIKENLYPKWRGHDYPENLEEMKNLSLDDLSHLATKGHSIGFHTQNHKDLASIDSKSELKEEIIDGAIALEEQLGLKINHFSFGFGNVDFFSEDALHLAQSHFEYVHTGMRGDNLRNTPKHALRRDTVSLDDTNIEVASFLEGSADSRYSKDFNKYESWLKSK